MAFYFFIFSVSASSSTCKTHDIQNHQQSIKHLMMHYCTDSCFFGHPVALFTFTETSLYAALNNKQSILGAETPRQSDQVSRQCKEMQGTIRVSSYRHHKLQFEISRGRSDKYLFSELKLFCSRTWLMCLIDVREKKRNDYRHLKIHCFKFINV